MEILLVLLAKVVAIVNGVQQVAHVEYALQRIQKKQQYFHQKNK